MIIDTYLCRGLHGCSAVERLPVDGPRARWALIAHGSLMMMPSADTGDGDDGMHDRADGTHVSVQETSGYSHMAGHERTRNNGVCRRSRCLSQLTTQSSAGVVQVGRCCSM